MAVRSLRTARMLVRSMRPHITLMKDGFMQSLPMPKDDRHTSLGTFLAVMAPITFRVPSAHQRVPSSTWRSPRQETTASTPSRSSPISASADSAATSTATISSLMSLRIFSVLDLTSASWTSREIPRSASPPLDPIPVPVPVLVLVLVASPPTDTAMARTSKGSPRPRSLCCLESATANLPTSPIPPVVAYRTATVLGAGVFIPE
mmetsp:Transcript_28278/g.66392  ORF Transcript_28278/g.66392 Transcript_28278/m.66392 type:complete len:205 (-) Transcript_28278:68-682(-)